MESFSYNGDNSSAIEKKKNELLLQIELP